MGLLVDEDAAVLKALIFDMSEKGAKQALFGMVDILKYHPSILVNVFRILIEDATKFNLFLKEDGLRGVR